MQATQIRLGLIGYGEIGSTLGRGLRERGLAHVAAYDKHAFDGPYSGLIQRRAREAGVALLPSPAALAGSADLILGVTPGSSSIDSAAAIAPHLGQAHVFVDVASATPRIKEQVGEILSPSGATVGDASILGTPRDGHAMPMVASGDAAEQMHDTLVPWGMAISVVGPKLGTASGIKILRSVVMKGMEALLFECVLASRHYGVDDYIIESIDSAFKRSFRDMVNALLTTGAIHAERRSEEVAMSAEAVADTGMDPIMSIAAARRLRWLAELDLKKQFNGVVPPSYQVVMEAIERAEGRS